jgi:hypothetical protein
MIKKNLEFGSVHVGWVAVPGQAGIDRAGAEEVGGQDHHREEGGEGPAGQDQGGAPPGEEQHRAGQFRIKKEISSSGHFFADNKFFT